MSAVTVLIFIKTLTNLAMNMELTGAYQLSGAAAVIDKLSNVRFKTQNLLGFSGVMD